MTRSISSKSLVSGVRNVRKAVKCVKSGVARNIIDVYTDGSCWSNGKSGSQAGYGVYFGPHNSMNISRPIEGNRRTNNVAEIQAVIAAAEIAVEYGCYSLRIYIDSKFVINAVTQWIPKWKRNGWRTASGQPVVNKVDFLQLDAALRQLVNYEFEYVRGHSGNPGNDMANKLANEGSRQDRGY